MLALHDWQRLLQRAIIADEASPELLHAIRRRGVIPEQRVGIYSEAYRMRLKESLTSNYPAIAMYLGEAEFSVLSQAYAAAYPSCHASIRWFGDNLGTFLHSQSPWSSDPILHELAQFEWALRHTVDAADKLVLTLDGLRTLPHESWPELHLSLQPAATLLHLDWNTPAFWSALVKQQELPVRQACPQHWLVYRRQDFMAMWRSADNEEAHLLQLVVDGVDFADMCDAMAGAGVEPEKLPAQAALLLHQWVETGLLVDTTAELRGRDREISRSNR